MLAFLFRKPPQELADLSTKAAVITEKIERVEAIPNEVNALKVELGRLSERVAGVEQNQNNGEFSASLRNGGRCLPASTDLTALSRDA